MEADAATAGVVDRGCQKVIEVDQHGGQHDQIGFFPVVAEEDRGDDGRNDEVQGDVNGWLSGLAKGRAVYF